MNRKATEKMIRYARDISEWVHEIAPDSDDFAVISDYISRNKPLYQKALQEEKWYWEAYMDSAHGDWGDR